MRIDRIDHLVRANCVFGPLAVLLLVSFCTSDAQGQEPPGHSPPLSEAAPLPPPPGPPGTEPGRDDGWSQPPAWDGQSVCPGGAGTAHWMNCPHCRSPRTIFHWSHGTGDGQLPGLDEPLVTDRPDFTEASSTVHQDVLQIEFGYTQTNDSEGGTRVRTQSLGEPLLRYGVLDWLEFRLAVFPVHERTRSGGRSSTVSGSSEDLYLGFKIGLTPQEGWLPEMALIPQMTVPTGSSEFTNDEALPGANWIYGWEINDFISTAGSTQVNRAVDETTGRSYSEIAQSWTVAYQLTDPLGAYTEWFALFPHSADTAQVEHYFNGGFTYLVNNDVQLDVRAGKGLNGPADDWFAGAGMSVRFR